MTKRRCSTKEGEFTDVNWYSGVSDLSGTTGIWQLNRDPQNVTPFLDIAWSRDLTTDLEQGALLCSR